MHAPKKESLCVFYLTFENTHNQSTAHGVHPSAFSQKFHIPTTMRNRKKITMTSPTGQNENPVGGAFGLLEL